MSKTIILGVIGSDAHVVGITILDQALQHAGFNVINLGVQTTQEEFIEAAQHHHADAILISSLYGHAKQDCKGFHTKLANTDIDAITYIGGNLAVGQDNFDQTRKEFRRLGFDRVFSTSTDTEEAIAALKEDLHIPENEQEPIKINT